MCGIFGYIGHKNTKDIILEGLKSLEYRGYDSWGVALKKLDGSIDLVKQIGKIGNSTIKDTNSNIGIGHTRWATHGGVTIENAHPHLSCNKEIVIVHNGIVENYLELKTQLEEKGHKFVSDTDSEVLAHYLEESYKKEVDPVLCMQNLCSVIKGLNAVIALFVKEETFVAYKNGSPVIIGKNNDEFFVSSDPVGIASYTDKLYFLEDGEIIKASKNSIELLNQDKKVKPVSFQTINFPKNMSDIGNYPHFMLKEINDQVDVITNILKTQKKDVEEVASKIKNAFGCFLVGCGTASYAGLAGVYFFSKIARRHLNTSFGSEFSYLINFIRRQSLVIALSQSGETIDTISSVKKAKEKGATLVSIINSPHSTLDRLSDKSLYLHAGPEKAVASTKAYTSKLAYLFLMAHAVAGSLKTGQSLLRKSVIEVKKVLDYSSKIKLLAKKIAKHDHIFILGRGLSYALALESALKIKEVSYIHAEGFPAGELKHGVIALIEKGTPVIVYNPKDETYEDTLSAAYEVKARGAFVIGVSEKKAPVYDVHIPVKFCSDATIIPQVVIAQLLGYYLALEKGLDPDKPRNLAKSVTVK